jgi:hypothetical protein
MKVSDEMQIAVLIVVLLLSLFGLVLATEHLEAMRYYNCVYEVKAVSVTPSDIMAICRYEK